MLGYLLSLLILEKWQTIEETQILNEIQSKLIPDKERGDLTAIRRYALTLMISGKFQDALDAVLQHFDSYDAVDKVRACELIIIAILLSHQTHLLEQLKNKLSKVEVTRRHALIQITFNLAKRYDVTLDSSYVKKVLGE